MNITEQQQQAAIEEAAEKASLDRYTGKAYDPEHDDYHFILVHEYAFGEGMQEVITNPEKYGLKPIKE